MLRALLYLKFTSAKNRILAQLRRLRQPKYLLGTAFVVVYFWFFFFRRFSSAANPMAGGGLPGMGSADMGPIILDVLALGLSLYLGLMWVVTGDTPGVKFTPPEIAFLFPAPLSRAALIHYKVLSVQLSSLVQSCFFALIFNHRHLASGHAVQTVLGWWTVITLISLHQLGASLTIARLAARGLHTTRRRLLALGVLALAGAVLCLAVWRAIPGPGASSSTIEWLSAVLTSGPVHWLLAPARTILAPSFAHAPLEFLRAFAPALAILAAHYLWVIRTEIAFEEASIVASERLAARIEQIRSTGTVTLGEVRRSGRRDPFDVSRAYWPELAFLWKNLLSTARPWVTARVWFGTATTVVLIAVVLQHTMGELYWIAGGAIAGLGAFTVAVTLIYGALLTRLDLRQDLANADILRTYPLPGWRIVLGEMLAPTAVLTGFIWFGLLAWFVGLHGHEPSTLSPAWFSPGMRIVLVSCAAVLTPFVVTLQLLVPNGAVVLFPGMFKTARTPGAGIDLMGQRMLFGFGQFLALALVFLPALGLGLASYFGMRGVLVVLSAFDAVSSTAPSPLASEVIITCATAAVLAGEIWCGVWWLGRRFEKIDLSSETQP